jgi:PleD family two-component response regulator
MNGDQWIKILPLTISLLQAIIWPLVVVTIVFYLRKPIKKFLENMGEFSLKAGPIETIVKQRSEVAASLAVAVATEQKQNGNGINQPESTKEVAKLVNQLITPQTSKRLDGTTALWVDDKPSNNTFQRNALEALAMRFTICTSTEDAIKELQARSFDIIIKANTDNSLQIYP